MVCSVPIWDKKESTVPPRKYGAFVCSVPIWDKKVIGRKLFIILLLVCSVPIWDKKLFIGGIGIGIAIGL